MPEDEWAKLALTWRAAAARFGPATRRNVFNAHG
jgi:hypothetical protein